VTRRHWIQDVAITGAGIALGGLVVWAIQRSDGKTHGASRQPAPAPPVGPPAPAPTQPSKQVGIMLTPGIVPSVNVSGQGGQLTIVAPPGGTITAITNGAGQYAQVNAPSWSKTYTPASTGLSGTFSVVWMDSAGNAQASAFGVTIT
jgi:hypothetical protein